MNNKIINNFPFKFNLDITSNSAMENFIRAAK